MDMLDSARRHQWKLGILIILTMVWTFCSLDVKQKDEYSEKIISKHNAEISYMNTEEQTLTIVGKTEKVSSMLPIMRLKKELELRNDENIIVNAEVSKTMWKEYMNGDKIKVEVTKSKQGNIDKAYIKWQY